ncbi:Transcription factor 25 [Biomphalaria glabrata]|nr:transcription factor 25 [Biomphalaria glabrata]
MSSRALRRLQGNSDLAKLENLSSDDKEGESESDTISKPKTRSVIKKTKVKHIELPENPFELLNEGDGDGTDTKEDVEANGENVETNNTQNISVKSRKKKKKNRKGKENSNQNTVNQQTADDIEASVLEVNRLLGDPGNSIQQADSGRGHFSLSLKPLLHIDYRHLNPETELKRIFGSQVVRGEHPRNRRQRNRPFHRSGRLVQPRDTWHSTSGSGLSMKYLGDTEGFVFEHSSAYQKVQQQFYDAVESGLPELIINILREHPYHVDTLIQMSDLHRATEDFQTAAESIEKALFGMECAFHSLFNLAAGNCYLDYKRRENRSFYLCLFKHILNLGRRGCNRTAFEFCKVLLSLDPENDPLDCMSMIDYFALRAEQYDHLLRLEQEVLITESMKHVPNFAMSIPLAHYHIARRDGGDIASADLLLQDSLLFFPMILVPLMDQCSVQLDKEVSGHSFFSTAELNDSTSELQRMITLYVKRCESCWKEAGVISWLEANVKAVLEIVNKEQDPRPKEYALLRKKRFRRPPLSTVRHYFLSEIQGLGLPRQYLGSSVLNYDPFPPHDSIAAYSRPPRQTVASEDHSGVLRTLLRSLMPSYNPYEPSNMRDRQQLNANEGDEGENEGAVGGNTMSQQLEHSVQAVMQAMRQLLSLPFGPAQGQDGNNQEDQVELEENEREWEEDEDNFDNLR